MTLCETVKKIDIRYRLTFCSTLLCGLLAQGMGLFNKFSWHDDIDLFHVGSTTGLGRWMLDILSNLAETLFYDGQYSLPLFNGMASLVMIGLAACLIVAVLDIRSDWLCVFTGGVLAASPTVTGTFAFMFTLPYYMFAVLLGFAGVWLICRQGRRWPGLFGAACICCSVGIYQGYLPMLLCVLLFCLIGRAVRNTAMTAAALVKDAVWMGADVLLAMLFYFGMTNLMVKVQGVALSSYQGISEMGRSSPQEYMRRVLFAYKDFFRPDRDSNYSTYQGSIRYIYYFIVAVGLLLAVYMVVQAFRRDRGKAAVLALLFLLVPLAVNFIFVMAGVSGTSALMAYAQTMPFILFAWMLDTVELPWKPLFRVLKVGGTALLLAVNVMLFRYDNKCYLKAAFTQQRAISYFTTLVTRIKSAEGYRDELPVSFLNAGHITDASLQELEPLNNIERITYDGINTYVNDYVWDIFMDRWCGYRPQIIDGSDIAETPAVAAMPSYPDDGSVKVIGDRVVVKF